MTLDQGQGLIALVQLEQGLGQEQRNLGIVLVVDQSALEGLDRQVVSLGGEKITPKSR